MAKRVKTVLAVAFCCVSLILLWFSTGQIRAIRAAQQHAPIVERVLAPYPEFKDMHFGAGTGHGGYFNVTGRVANIGELSKLKSLVMETHPPVKVRFYVRIGDPRPDSR